MLTKEEVAKIAKLARLELTGAEIEKMQKDLSAVLDYFNLLKEAPTKQISLSGLGTRASVLRKDEANPQTQETNEKLVEAFPDKKGSHNKVKAIF